MKLIHWVVFSVILATTLALYYRSTHLSIVASETTALPMEIVCENEIKDWVDLENGIQIQDNGCFIKGEAIVVSRKNYIATSLGDAKVVPFDLVLSWGSLSSAKKLGAFTKIYQNNRWFFYEWDDTAELKRLKIDHLDMDNFHIIDPEEITLLSTQKEMDIVSELQPGEVIRFKAKLVNLRKSTGQIMRKSSVSLRDRSPHSCEQMVFESIEIL